LPASVEVEDRMSWLVRCVVAACLAGAAIAPVRADTILRLSETATVKVHPDELAATLRAEATSSSAADAQQRVNATMADALARAKQVTGLTVSTGSYTVWRTTTQDRAERWQGSQTLLLSSANGATLLALVGDLQQKGMAVGQLAWQVSDDATHKARAEATRQALMALRGRADEAAAILDLRFGSFKEIRLDSARPSPIMPRAMMATTAMAAPVPPNAVAEDVSISATADADIVLLPR
jgi:predicted secreted protein